MTQSISTKSSGVQLAAKRIQELIGLDLGTLTTRSMQRALQIRREALGLSDSDTADYLSLLDSDAEELQNLIDEVVVPETWFHREPEAIDMMVSLARQARRSAQRRSTLQALLSFCNVFSLLLASFISGQVYRLTQSFHAVAWLAGGCALLSILLLARIPEPRRAPLIQGNEM